MLTLCPGLDCPNANDCERNVRFKRKYAYPHATTYPVDKQPGRLVTVTLEVNGVAQAPTKQWACSDFTRREQPT
jgi:hypothetical protein